MYRFFSELKVLPAVAIVDFFKMQPVGKAPPELLSLNKEKPYNYYYYYYYYYFFIIINIFIIIIIILLFKSYPSNLNFRE